MPPFLPPRTEAQRYSRKAAPVTYTEFPEPVIRRQPTALPPASRPLELSPPAVAEPQPPPAERTSPGTWREIIARFEAEPGEPERPEPPEVTPPVEPTAEAVSPAEPEREEAPGQFEHLLQGEEEPEPLAWELEALTTPDYDAPRSIHVAEHDSWPVAAQDGNAVPAWADEEDTTEAAGAEGRAADEYDEIGELILDDVVATPGQELELAMAEMAAAPPADFPLDAFIVPAGVRNVPTGYDAEHVALLVAHRLDALAQQLRDDGLGALGRASSVDELSRVLAAIVTGYIARDA